MIDPIYINERVTFQDLDSFLSDMPLPTDSDQTQTFLKLFQHKIADGLLQFTSGKEKEYFSDDMKNHPFKIQIHNQTKDVLHFSVKRWYSSLLQLVVEKDTKRVRVAKIERYHHPFTFVMLRTRDDAELWKVLTHR